MRGLAAAATALAGGALIGSGARAAPGVSPVTGPSSVLYTSPDGVDWSTAPTPSDLYLADLAATATRLYVVGTGPATAATGTTKVGWTDDSSRIWHQTTLPIDTAAIGAKPSTANGEVVNIAAGPKAVVAVA